MGTRNLTIVVKGGEYKVAQYGQFDGYPSGNGVVVLEFLRGVDLKEFNTKVSALRWLDDVECENIESTPNWTELYPHLSRNAGVRILQMVMDGADSLVNTISFAGDSLFCEWAYLIDLDDNTLEVYKGFNKTPITEGRFKSGDDTLEHDSQNAYHPIKLVMTYLLSNLPTNADFVAELEPKEEDE